MNYLRACFNSHFIKLLPFLILASSCGKETSFLYIVNKSNAPKIEPCECPDGFFQNEDQKQCVRETRTEPRAPGNPSRILLGDDNASYFSRPVCLTDVSKNKNWPFDTQVDQSQGVTLLDSKSTTVPYKNTVNNYWRDRVIGFNRVGVKGVDNNIWYTKTFCIDIKSPKDYVMQIGADNKWKIKIDGKDFAFCDDNYCHIGGLFMNEGFAAGKHLVELKYLNIGGPASVWFEVFDNTLQDVVNAKKDSDMNVVYSTRSLIGQNWDYSGEICPEGYAYDICNADKMCSKIEYQSCNLGSESNGRELSKI